MSSSIKFQKSWFPNTNAQDIEKYSPINDGIISFQIFFFATKIINIFAPFRKLTIAFQI